VARSLKGPRPFWLRPKWVFGHILCFTLVVTFVNLGFWQLRRLDEKRDRNELIRSREEAPPTSVDEALRNGAEAAAYRRIRDEGTWDAAGTVLVRSRSLDGDPGYHVLTPLDLGDQVIIVNRGFARLGGGGDQAILETVRPAGDLHVRVEGVLRPSESRGSFGPKDPSTGRLSVVNRVDIPRLQRQISEPLAPLFLQLQSSQPPPGDVLRLLPLPATDEGPHLSYAVQWFIFATVGAVGWPLLLRKQGRDTAVEEGRRADKSP
jgi:surfeit locus 1 family protein